MKTKNVLLIALGAGGLLLGACVTESSSEKNAEGAAPTSQRAPFDDESYSKPGPAAENGSSTNSATPAPDTTGTVPASSGAGGSGTGK